MVETISPVVHGGRNRSYWLSIVMHVLGAAVAATLFGALLGGMGGLFGGPWGTAGTVVITITALIYLLRESLQLPIPTFDRKEQVPEWWRTFYSRPMASLLYGLSLGIGFTTYLTFGTFVVVTIAALISGNVGHGALLVGAFGVSRSVSLIATGRIDVDSIGKRMDQGRRTNAAVLALVVTSGALGLV
ncbi:MAG: hypothetical protein ACLGIB_11155 [Actinomycetota bacterium]